MAGYCVRIFFKTIFHKKTFRYIKETFRYNHDRRKAKLPIVYCGDIRGSYIIKKKFGVSIVVEIAVCEDEQPIREYIKRLTEQLPDVHVSAFERGEDLIKDKTVFDIVLLDISLDSNEKAKINGIEAAKQVRAKSAAIIIFITALKWFLLDRVLQA